MGWGVGVAHAWPLNTRSALRPAGGPTVSGGLWRGHRQPCTSRPHGGATGSEWPTSAKDRASSTYRASAGGTCSARGEQNGAPPLRMFQKPGSTLTQKLPEIQAQLSGRHSGCREAGRNPAIWVHRSQKDAPELVASACEAPSCLQPHLVPPGNFTPASPSRSVKHTDLGWGAVQATLDQRTVGSPSTTRSSGICRARDPKGIQGFLNSFPTTDQMMVPLNQPGRPRAEVTVRTRPPACFPLVG